MKRDEWRDRELRHFGLPDLVREGVLSVNGRVLRGDYLNMRDLNRGTMKLARGGFDRIVTGVLGISKNGLVGPERIAGTTSLLSGCGSVMVIHLGCVVRQGRGVNFIKNRLLESWGYKNRLLESWGYKEGILEFLEPRETRETGTWWLFTDGSGPSVVIF